MRRVAVFFAIGALGLVAQATVLTLLPFGVLKPDVVLLVLLYLGGKADPIEGGAVAFALGYVMDVLSGAMFGTFTLTKVLVFFGAHLVAKRVYLTAGLVPGIVALLFTIFEAVTIRIVFRSLGLDAAGLDRALVRYLLPQALLMGVLAPFAFHYLGRLDAWLGTRAGVADERRPAPLV